LRARLAAGLRVERHRRPTRPSRGAKLRRLDAKRRQGERKRGRRRPQPGD
ncbi:MAG: alternative ribosome rescue aminoacyl-tRNA hydrolase ArfB, partial [Acidimicrobiales bacterium]